MYTLRTSLEEMAALRGDQLEDSTACKFEFAFVWL
jgi:hypothetical protein